jgi:hypothetical protein
MDKPQVKRHTTSQLSCWLLLIAITTLTGCKACTKVTPIDANLIVQGSIGDCHYQSAIGQQSVYIDIKGTSANNSSYSWTQTLASVTSSTYAVKVPSQGTFKITVFATETAGTTACPACSAVCGNMVTTTPRWKGSDEFTGTTLVVTVELPTPPTPSDCGC